MRDPGQEYCERIRNACKYGTRLSMAEIDHIILTAIENSERGGQDPVWDSIYEALEILRMRARGV